jgi:hypothetical protein
MTSMTTSTSAATVTTNLMAKLIATDDEDKLKMLLGLFEGVPAADLPIEELTDFLLTTDNDENLWLITATMTEVWDTIVELLNKNPENIPEERVIEALQHALDAVDATDDESDSDHDACLERLASFAIALSAYPADIQAALLAHPRGFVQDIGLDVLYQLDREPEILPFLADPDWEVRVSAINKAWRFALLATLQTMAQQYPEEQVRTTATQMAVLAQQQTQATPTS